MHILFYLSLFPLTLFFLYPPTLFTYNIQQNHLQQMNKTENDTVWTQIYEKINKSFEVKQPEELEKVKIYFSHDGKSFSNPEIVDYCIGHSQFFQQLPKDKKQTNYILNPFQAHSHDLDLDLLTDSGTSTLTKDQLEFKKWYLTQIPPIEVNAYAGLTPKIHLNNMVKQLFGQHLLFYLTIQGRAAERLLLGAMKESKAMYQGDTILSNRPFDTTKGQIQKNGFIVESLTPVTNPEEFFKHQDVFLGNIPGQVFMSYAPEQYKTVLITMTDNGSGGQPVSMQNYKKIVQQARRFHKIVWVDACRIFQNAVFIKTFETDYKNSSILDIVRQIASQADILTISFKKIYSHGGGGILLNRNSQTLAKYLTLIDKSIKYWTTADYGNGFDSYSGITGQGMIQIMSGLLCAINEKIISKRISQVGEVALNLRQSYNLPLIAGGHAIYIATQKILKNVQLQNCPAEYLNAILMNALHVRGCGLGYIVYGKRENGKVVKNSLTMDSLRLAIPRQTYSRQQLLERLSILGKAYIKGLFDKLKGGLKAIDYADDGFYHFGAKYEIIDRDEFQQILREIKKIKD